MNRRGFLTGLIAAPAVILTPGLIMPVRPWIVPVTFSAAMSIDPDSFEWRYLYDNASGRVWEWVEDGQEGGAAVWKEIDRLQPRMALAA
jgi:hypothetical protein